MAYIVRKSSKPQKTVATPVQITRIQDAFDADFGVLDESQDGKFITYNSSTRKFDLSSADQLLLESVSDNDLPDPFVRVMETEIFLENLFADGVDAGEF